MEIKNQAASIQKAIKTYAASYRELQNWQDNSLLIPKGDQKTGCIGEYYAYLFISSKYPDAILSYGTHSEKGWDIQVTIPDGASFRIQVKTVSAYSATRNISPIHHGWDELYLVYLNRMLEPEGFWIIQEPSIVDREGGLKNKKCPIPGKTGTGSKKIPYGDNLIADMRCALSQFFID